MLRQQYPCSLPVDVCPPPVPPSAPLTYSHAELITMPRCGDVSPALRQRCITVQQPPKLIMHRKQILTKKRISLPIFSYNFEKVSVPTIIESEKIVRVPMITWSIRSFNVPKIHWYPSYVPYPRIISIPRVTVEPKEICQTVLCQPKPQIIDIPPPDRFCLYETGQQTLNCTPPCSPIPPPPCPPFPPCTDTVH